MASRVVFREGFLDRAKRMSGIKTDESFAAAIGISESRLESMRKGAEVGTDVLSGLFDAFGFTPGEVVTIATDPHVRSQKLVA
ncbi:MULTISPECIES: helix-turn-helix domain-containing protein [Bifidobacterium]|nr:MULTISPECIES: helix-turn-helix transcriptional regulator [Bifidobacterium]